MLFGQAKEIKDMHFAAYRLSFTTESPNEVKNILQVCEASFVTEKKNLKDIYHDDFTYGHYKRGVE